jgi:hypothetical protein
MKVRLSDVQTPKTVEEFRMNLKKFCLNFGRDKLYVKDVDGIDLNKISSLSDLYRLTGKSRVEISPKVDLGMETVEDFMNKTKQYISCNGLFEDESNFTLYDDTNEFLENSNNIKWVTIDNQIYRELFMKLFGNFSGYVNS